jgi:hypothetical protein
MSGQPGSSACLPACPRQGRVKPDSPNLMPRPVTYACWKPQLSRLLTRRTPSTSGPAPQITKCPGVPGGRPAEQQPDHPPHRSGGNYTIAARPASPPRLQDQAAPLASQLRIILHGLRDIFVDRHGTCPRQRSRQPLRPALALTPAEDESCPEIHPQHRRIAGAADTGPDTGSERRFEAPQTGHT